MSIFRPSNINKRLTGTRTTVSGGSPGNGGFVGPTTPPYCIKNACCATIQLGGRFFGGGGCRSGVFKLRESSCGLKEGCKTAFNPSNDCKGFFICCGPGTCKWFVAPECSEATATWYSRGAGVSQANTCMGSCGWFLPSCAQFLNPGAVCAIYWDGGCDKGFWTDSQGAPGNCNFMAFAVNPANAGAGQGIQSNSSTIRTFRYTNT